MIATPEGEGAPIFPIRLQESMMRRRVAIDPPVDWYRESLSSVSHGTQDAKGKRMRFRLMCLALMCHGGGFAAHAQTSASPVIVVPPPAPAAEELRFGAGDREFSMTRPSRFCIPTSDQAATVAAMTLGDDRAQETALTLFDCDGEIGAFVMIKTSPALRRFHISRTAYLQAVRDAFADPETERRMTAGGEGADMQFPGGFRARVTGSMRPDGTDDMCGYQYGIFHYSAAQLEFTETLAVCNTSVSGEIFSVYRYSRDGSADQASLRDETRAIAETIRLVR
ncbi:MAG: hypothetical protein CMN73_02845 [Sphingomonas sp.]|nr:hypothetical protein [Sphingomonas sp.]|tara:strand:- start:82 stop:924 length:843 start_codon:yes stop_codon:yes gene_type:complete